jgi:hypothetical protein
MGNGKGHKPLVFQACSLIGFPEIICLTNAHNFFKLSKIKGWGYLFGIFLQFMYLQVK